MFNSKGSAPQLAVMLAFLTLWTSFAWGLPAEAPGAADDATPAQPKGAPEADTAGPAVNAGLEPHPTNGWFHLGLGLGTAALKNWGSDLMANAALRLKRDRYLGSLSATTAGGSGAFDVGLLFGYYPHQKFGVSAGVAWVKGGIYHEDTIPGWFSSAYEEISYTVGVPVEIQFAVVNGRVVGLGLVAHVNFNKENIFGGVTVGIDLGKLE